MSEIMMKCGHASQGYKVVGDECIPCCVICDETEQAPAPDLTGRTARCSYYGMAKINRRYANDECNYGCKGKTKCECGSEPSKVDLAFFKHHPDKEQDEFYCGCMGWD
jgi:hypothetical protein